MPSKCPFIFLVIISLALFTAPTNAVAVAATAGPLGSPAGNPPGTIPAGSGSDSNETTTTTDEILEDYEPVVRALDTVLAVVCVILTTTTYAVLIGPGTRLLSTCKLPLTVLEENIGNLLSRAWPDTSESTASTDPPGGGPTTTDSIRLLYVGQMDGEPHQAARGVTQCNAVPNERIQTPPMWLTTGSSLTKSMVQLAVWEWVCLWTALSMLVSTLAFNGFLTNERGPDSYPRLVVVVIYASAFCTHFWYVFRTIMAFFTLVIAGSSWSLLNKAAFRSVELAQLKARLEGGPTSPTFRELGKPAANPAYAICPATLLQDVDVVPIADKETMTDTQQSEARTVGDWQKRDITSAVDSGRTALDGVVANVMTMVGIVITTGFSGWTTRPTDGTVSSQLGSLALLASLTLGAAAMFSSAIDLSVMLTSFRNILFLKEVLLNGEASGHVQKRASNRKVVGFTHKTVTPRPLGLRDLAISASFWPLVIFGPAYTLLPSEEDHDRQSMGAKFELGVRVRGKKVIFTTETTDRHNTKPDGTNVGSINVCHEIPSMPSTEAPRISKRRNPFLTFLRDSPNRISVKEKEKQISVHTANVAGP
ncbi:uncharacterized protein Z518_06738 [Rhinocladiella mackenziei CBS 650.93]|uniref:Rhinocladiella mackenziei CBS 650.93 unplaced genomic scaffold supercont1.5, whole genome shotgun sequence n=1 Tax=Rhinocladiella mackenziei CBS 650.93 TaxID=1442369 RepID=A0A0D2IIR4_9EURO|nr:uncharacterized protein Z518_06738 [Rhinocladiella mackenziei CBS 650.93]KIX03186.1 hypothetical protein Z518_06738 [Rhinocladiella mackenziei CBS 650.93]